MIWRDPEFWNDLSQIAPILLILLSALAGGASTFIKDNKPFNFFEYLYEVFSGIIAGYITYLILHAFKLEYGICVAGSAIAAYFGTKILIIFYQIFIVRLNELVKFNKEDRKGN